MLLSTFSKKKYFSLWDKQKTYSLYNFWKLKRDKDVKMSFFTKYLPKFNFWFLANFGDQRNKSKQQLSENFMSAEESTYENVIASKGGTFLC